MTADEDDLRRETRDKARAALRLLIASLDAYVPFDPSVGLSPKELEPYDELADRFIRAVESALRTRKKAARTELIRQGVPATSWAILAGSGTLRLIQLRIGACK